VCCSIRTSWIPPYGELENDDDSEKPSDGTKGKPFRSLETLCAHLLDHSGDLYDLLVTAELPSLRNLRVCRSEHNSAKHFLLQYGCKLKRLDIRCSHLQAPGKETGTSISPLILYLDQCPNLEELVIRDGRALSILAQTPEKWSYPSLHTIQLGCGRGDPPWSVARSELRCVQRLVQLKVSAMPSWA
jgi:hypothetical protein